MRLHWPQRCLMALLVALAACSGKSKEESELLSSNGADLSKENVDPRQAAALVDLIVKEAASLRRAEFDPEALAGKLGPDPQAHFHWVRDHTWWAPYRGLLRGSQGVMLDRVGSSLDRAVLLGVMLRHGGHSVRLARARLPEERARALLGKVQPIAADRIPTNSSMASADRSSGRELSPGDKELIDRKMAEAQQLEANSILMIRSQADQILALVREKTTDVSQMDDRAHLQALQEHWWVEREENGNWIAMDVLLPDARMGDSIASATAVYDWASNAAVAAIPDDEWHSVRLRVVVERYENNMTSESTVLDTTFRPAEVIDQPIVLGHLPDPWPERLPEAKTDANAIGNTAVNVSEWVPYLQVGEKYIVQSAMTEAGHLKTSPLAANRDINETGGGGLLGGMDMALGGGETAASQMTAEWLDFEVHVPGAKVQHLRRPIFDLFGPANRAAKSAGFDASTNELMVRRYEALLSSTDILLQPCEVTGEFIAHLMLESVVRNQDAFRELSRESDRRKAGELASTLLDRIAAWGPLWNLAMWRSTLGSYSEDTFIGRTNVLTYRVGQPVVQSAVSFREQIDIASNETQPSRGKGMDAFETRLRQGVADTIAEIATLTADLTSAQNAAAVFAGMAAGVDAMAVIEPHDAKTAAQLGWPEDVAARLARDVESGYMAVVPTRAVSLDGQQRLAWWRVDPRSGETIGVMDTGYHGTALGERAAIDDLLEVLAVRLRAYAGNSANARWAKSARDFVTRPGVKLSRADMDRLAMHTRLMRLSKRLTELGYGI